MSKRSVLAASKIGVKRRRRDEGGGNKGPPFNVVTWGREGRREGGRGLR